MTQLNQAHRAAWSLAVRNIDLPAAGAAAAAAVADLGVTGFGDQIITPVLEAIGAEWEAGEASLAEVYMTGRISQEVLATLVEPVTDAEATVGIALLDDHHGLGKTLVLTALQVARVPVVDLGTLGARELAEAARDRGLEYLLISTLMLRSALRVRDVIDHLGALDCPTRVIVGGAPFRMDPTLWQRVGAHGCGVDASAAVSLVQAARGDA